MCDEVYRLSSHQFVVIVKLRMTRRKFSAVRTEIQTESGQLTDQLRLKQEVRLKATDVPCEPDGEKARSVQLDGHEHFMQTSVYCIPRRAGGLRAGIQRV